jgi:branched-subunit amino acid transport protein
VDGDPARRCRHLRHAGVVPGRRLPPGRLLRQIPPAALASIVVPALLRPEGHLDLFQPRLAAGVAAAVVAWRTRNVGLTLAVGLVGLYALQSL